MWKLYRLGVPPIYEAEDEQDPVSHGMHPKYGLEYYLLVTIIRVASREKVTEGREKKHQALGNLTM
ncbi:MAG: hypothetical protein EHM79_12235 [Geobacter sp.]|nr:MAG: hypothetical protein EHM79_12235 [Geobacter sp.]